MEGEAAVKVKGSRKLNAVSCALRNHRLGKARVLDNTEEKNLKMNQSPKQSLFNADFSVGWGW